ncbi:dihydrofolate reductase [Candidatus Dojkabacteria bacterium]|uniref:Dihydrofolate reductase n=1 Tax=Candidatus Dojkabacteria bacterium TaxID=2099670 RepID=A0A955L415_9BACT|nr:dihydrofolate reductase [Candidatus Dojkabacteria bacterium]
MKVTIFNAISADGYISDRNGYTKWASDNDYKFFLQLVKKSRVILMGRKTYELNKSLFPFNCDLNIVITSDKELIQNSYKKALFTNEAPDLIIKNLEGQNYSDLLVIGGGLTNSLFLNSGLVDEIILDVHPILLGKGTNFATELSSNIPLELINTTKLDSQHLVLQYRVR